MFHAKDLPESRQLTMISEDSNQKRIGQKHKKVAKVKNKIIIMSMLSN